MYSYITRILPMSLYVPECYSYVPVCYPRNVLVCYSYVLVWSFGHDHYLLFRHLDSHMGIRVVAFQGYWRITWKPFGPDLWSVWQPNPIELPEFDWFQFNLSTERNDYRTFDCVRLVRCFAECECVRLQNPIEINPTTEVGWNFFLIICNTTYKNIQYTDNTTYTT